MAYPRHTKRNSSGPGLLQKAASSGCSALASGVSSSLGAAVAAFVQLWAHIHSPCQTLLGYAIIHLWSLNNLFAQVPGDTWPALPIFAPRIGSGLLASHGSPLGVLDPSKLHAGISCLWDARRSGEVINSAPKMQKHFVWRRCGPSQLKGHKTSVRKSDTKTEPSDLARAHLKVDLSAYQPRGSANPCHELEEHHSWAKLKPCPRDAQHSPQCTLSTCITLFFTLSRVLVALPLDRRDSAVTRIHTNTLCWFWNTIQKSPSPNSWEPLNFQATTKVWPGCLLFVCVTAWLLTSAQVCPSADWKCIRWAWKQQSCPSSSQPSFCKNKNIQLFNSLFLW